MIATPAMDTRLDRNPVYHKFGKEVTMSGASKVEQIADSIAPRCGTQDLLQETILMSTTPVK